jgi:hypothetical protein
MKHNNSGLWASVLLLLSLLFCSRVHAFPCANPSTVDSFSGLPQSPIFPTAYLPNAATGGFITDHWSEKAIMERPPKISPLANPSLTNCPHLQSGLSNWHDPNTWGGIVPTGNKDVNVPVGKHVLISSCSIDPNNVFGIINVPAGSSLIFADAQISIKAKGFKVNGKFLIGSPTCRLRNKITITLSAPRQDNAPREYKGIYVEGGQIDVHGVRYTPTWSRLAKTANPGDSVIYIQDVVNWQPGQTIVVTTTEKKDARDWHRNEEKIIQNVYLVNGFTSISAIQLTTPLQYKHYGGSEYQAEVGLLSRNIVIQGDASNSEPTDTNPSVCYDKSNPGSSYPCPNSYLTGYGAHVLVAMNTAIARFEGVEFYRVGQTNQLAKYPVHFHMMGVTTGPDQASIRDCAVHRSYFRCMTIHATNNSLLSENTAYDIIGHCYVRK